MRKVVLFIAMSLDGYIADENGSIDFLESTPVDENEDCGYGDFNKTVDTVIVGKNTYNKVRELGFDYPHEDKDVYIISNTPVENNKGFHTYSGDLSNLISTIRKKEGKNIYCDGGAEIVDQLLNNNLINEFIITIIPVMLGNGIKLFKGVYPYSKLCHIKSKAYPSGLVQHHYEIKN